MNTEKTGSTDNGKQDPLLSRRDALRGLAKVAGAPEEFTPPDQVRKWVREFPTGLKIDPAALLGP